MAFEIETTDQLRRSELRKHIGNQFIFQFQRNIVIDRDREIVFMDLGGQGELPRDRGECASFFCLLWEGKVITLDGYWSGEMTSEGYRKIIKLDNFSVPLSLQPKIDEIKNILSTTFSMYETYLSKREVSVHLQFPETRVYPDDEVKV